MVDRYILERCEVCDATINSSLTYAIGKKGWAQVAATGNDDSHSDGYDERGKVQNRDGDSGWREDLEPAQEECDVSQTMEEARRRYSGTHAASCEHLVSTKHATYFPTAVVNTLDTTVATVRFVDRGA